MENEKEKWHKIVKITTIITLILSCWQIAWISFYNLFVFKTDFNWDTLAVLKKVFVVISFIEISMYAIVIFVCLSLIFCIWKANIFDNKNNWIKFLVLPTVVLSIWTPLVLVYWIPYLMGYSRIKNQK
ncbi:hypothetical protein [Spiroplasma endosymbiont of Crioceris asparagi]|uniref:hypothetical protein n=1 Tax=Spiroplasma endosymbiont of Crioceris asparagi TaxID=3066286 RepID=UPI0030D210C4